MMAKFPMFGDRINNPAWEKVALDLAALAGITVPRSQLIRVGSHNVLLLDRFDRDGSTRIPYATYRTLLNNRDDGTRRSRRSRRCLRAQTWAKSGDSA